MERKHPSLRILTLLLSCALLFPLVAAADSDNSNKKYRYAAKFVCGFNEQATARVIPGYYATAVNIHNPSYKYVDMTKKIALTFPPAEQAPGPVSEKITHTLGPDQALEVDCEEIPSEFFPDDQFPPYVKGFLVIESSRKLDVSAVYTAGDLQGVVRSIDVEQIKERKAKKRDDDDDDDDDDNDES